MNQQPNPNGYPYNPQTSPQPLQQGYTQQPPMQQPGYAPPVQPGYGQPVQQQGYQQPTQRPGYQQPMPQGYQQPAQQPGYQPPMQQGYQQPMQQSYTQPSPMQGYNTQSQAKMHPYPQPDQQQTSGHAVLSFFQHGWDYIRQQGLWLPALAMLFGFAYALYVTIAFAWLPRLLPHILLAWLSVVLNGAACVLRSRPMLMLVSGISYLITALLFLNRIFFLLPSVALCVIDYLFPPRQA